MIDKLDIRLLILLILTIVGCRHDLEEYPIPPSRDDRPYSLSTDTIQLDTLPSLLLSSTYSLRLFNPNNQPLELSSIRLSSNGSTGFRLNVDGHRQQAEQLRIEARDSIFIFVRAFLPEGPSDTPTPVADSIVVTEPSGRISYIPIVAVRQNVRHLSDLIVHSPKNLNDSRPILIRDSIYIAQGASLSLSAGTRLLMAHDAYIRVDGELRAEGQEAGHIHIGSIRRDQFLPRVPYSRVPGQWGGIIVGKAGRITASYTTLINAKWGIYFADDEVAEDLERLSLSHCRLSNFSGVGISATRGQYSIEDSELSNTLGPTLSLSGGVYSIRRSSIINLYPWPGIRSTPALSYSDSPRTGGQPQPTSRLLLEHCVLDGSLGVHASGTTGGELELSLGSSLGDSPRVRLRECYLRARQFAPPLVETLGIVYAEAAHEPKKLYQRVGLDSLGRKDYLFDYRPRSEAPFVGQIRPQDTALPADLAGKARPTPATWGAYEPAE